MCHHAPQYFCSCSVPLPYLHSLSLSPPSDTPTLSLSVQAACSRSHVFASLSLFLSLLLFTKTKVVEGAEDKGFLMSCHLCQSGCIHPALLCSCCVIVWLNAVLGL